MNSACTVYILCMHGLHTEQCAQFTYWTVCTVHVLCIYYSYTVHTFKNIKNGFQGTIYTFKNYFATMFSVSVIISSIHIKETSQCRWVKKKKRKKILFGHETDS